MRIALRQFSEALEKLAAGAVFCGVRRGADLAAHDASADLFLLPSLTETFGNVLLEAMASGLATIAFDYAAAGMLVHHGVDESKARSPRRVTTATMRFSA